jgi:hypothetical protein
MKSSEISAKYSWPNKEQNDEIQDSGVPEEEDMLSLVPTTRLDEVDRTLSWIRYRLTRLAFVVVTGCLIGLELRFCSLPRDAVDDARGDDSTSMSVSANGCSGLSWKNMVCLNEGSAKSDRRGFIELGRVRQVA